MSISNAVRVAHFAVEPRRPSVIAAVATHDDPTTEHPITIAGRQGSTSADDSSLQTTVTHAQYLA